MSEQDVRDAHAAGEQASHDRQTHYHERIQGQAAQAGDPQPAVSTLTPPETPPPLPRDRRAGR